MLATLHTTSAAKTIDRLVDAVPSGDKAMVRTMLSSSLLAVIAQVLLKRADGAGRLAAYEVLVGSPAIANLIRENQIAQINSMIQTGARFGMQLMPEAIQALVAAGRIDRAEAQRALQAQGDEPAPAAPVDAGEPAPAGRRAHARDRRDPIRLPLLSRTRSIAADPCQPRRRRRSRRALLATLLGLGMLAACHGQIPVMDQDRYAGLTRDDFRTALEPRPAPPYAPEAATSGPPIPDLQPLVELPPTLSPAERKLVSIAVDETVPLKDVLIELARKAEVDLELDPRIEGGVILTMRDRPLREVIERIADLAGLRFEFRGSSLKIELDDPYYVNYRVDYLHLIRQANSRVETSVNVMGGDQAQAGADGNASTSAVAGQSVADFWQELEASLSQILNNSRPQAADRDAGRGAAPERTARRRPAGRRQRRPGRAEHRCAGQRRPKHRRRAEWSGRATRPIIRAAAPPRRRRSSVAMPAPAASPSLP